MEEGSCVAVPKIFNPFIVVVAGRIGACACRDINLCLFPFIRCGRLFLRHDGLHLIDPMLGLGQSVDDRSCVSVAALSAYLLFAVYPHGGTLAQCEAGAQALAQYRHVGIDHYCVAVLGNGGGDVLVYLVVVGMCEGE